MNLTIVHVPGNKNLRRIQHEVYGLVREMGRTSKTWDIHYLPACSREKSEETAYIDEFCRGLKRTIDATERLLK